MRRNARVVVCDKHEEVYHTIDGVGYEYDADLWGECPLCWLFEIKTDDEYARKAAEKFRLNVAVGDLAEVWSARSVGSLSIQAALASMPNSGIEPPEYDGPKHAFDALVEARVLTPDDGEYDPHWEWMILRSLTGGRFLCNRVPWPTGRMEFAGAFPEDEEFSMIPIPEGKLLSGLPDPEMVNLGHGESVRIYKKEGEAQ